MSKDCATLACVTQGKVKRNCWVVTEFTPTIEPDSQANIDLLQQL